MTSFISIILALSKKYLSFGIESHYGYAFAKSSALPPAFYVSQVNEKTSHPGIRVTYYDDLDRNHQFGTDLYDPDEYDADNLISCLVANIEDEKWTNCSDYFVSDVSAYMPLPFGFIEVLEMDSGVRKLLKVYQDESDGASLCTAPTAMKKENLNIDMKFDIAVPTVSLAVGVSYEIKISNVGMHLSENRTFRHSIVLEGISNGYALAFAAYNTMRGDLKDRKYDVMVNENLTGFFFRPRTEDMHNIWFRLAWIKTGAYPSERFIEAVSTFVG